MYLDVKMKMLRLTYDLKDLKAQNEKTMRCF